MCGTLVACLQQPVHQMVHHLQLTELTALAALPPAAAALLAAST